MIWKYFINTSIDHFNLQDILVISQDNMLGNFEWEHGFELVSFGLELCDLPFQEINTGIRHLLQVMSINVLRTSLEIVKLLLEVFGCVIHINLQMIMLFTIDFKGYDEAHGFLRTQSINHCRHQSLLV